MTIEQTSAKPRKPIVSEEEERQRQIERNQAAIRLLHSPLLGTREEQEADLKLLMEILDAERGPDEKLFP